ncbi:30S ribosomal protein S5 [Candidatus Shikimatogenerans silvanidophilus]|uniref:30S ribosomal protein S5 n=1 Tax=Candidatus Shikimatogenerans silvanidophilus TaxID=2782547 RepID=UPI001BA981E2|nr:30S ribosomal protein S5 [Candidatus Shikimatogenerans silvanidophilus]
MNFFIKKKVKKGIKDLKEKLLFVKRVCKVTKGRRYFSFNSIVLKGNYNGTIGFGFGKAKEALDAIHKAGSDATKNLINIPIINDTIPHEQTAKFKGTYVSIFPATKGTGIISCWVIRVILEIAGIKNILSKVIGSYNSKNITRATMKALSNLRSIDMILKQRGITLKKLFNG